jgi:hypothetical protein
MKQNKHNTMKEANKLGTIMGAAALTGHVTLGALAGLFKPENFLMLSVCFIAGPGTIITAFLLDGDMKQRMFAALLAGIMATTLVIFAAGVGVKAFSFLNVDVLRKFGGVAVMTIGLIVMGVKFVPARLPLMILGGGLVAGLLLK